MPLTVPAKFKTLAQMLKEEAEKTTAARETAAVPTQPKAHSFDASPQPAKTPKTATPTLSRDLAAAYAISQMDEQLGDKLFQNIAAGTRDALNYSPYLQPTNSTPIRELNRLGVDATKIDKEFFDRYAWLKPHTRYLMNGVPMAPISGSSPEESAAYYYAKLWNAEEQTEKAETELISLNREVNYWAKRVDRNYSDEEILGRIDWKKYPTLTRMREGKERGKPILLNRGVEFNEDTVYGMLWSARNGESTGSHTLDAMQYARGKGRKYEADPNVKAKLDPANQAYNPYAVGSTVDEAAEYFDVSTFNQDWLDKNRNILNSADENAKRMYRTVYDAEQFTRQAEGELNGLQKEIDARFDFYAMAETVDPEAILQGILEDYPALRRMDEGRLGSGLAGLTRPLGYRYEDVATSVNDKASIINKRKGSTKNGADLAAAAQNEKSAVIAAEGNALQNAVAPKSLTARKSTLWDQGAAVAWNSNTWFRPDEDAGYNAILGVLQGSPAGGMDALATNEGAVTMAADMIVDAANAETGGTVIDPKIRTQYDQVAHTVLGMNRDSIFKIASFLNDAMNVQNTAVERTDLTRALSTIARMDDTALRQVLDAFVSEDGLDLPTAQTLFRLMKLREAMVGKVSGADGMTGDALVLATSNALKSTNIDTGNPDLDDVLMIAASTTHNLDIARERWGMAGVNYIGSLIQSGHAKEAVLIASLPSHAKAVIVAEENMRTVALNQDAILAQANAAAQDMQNPHLLKNAAKRAEQQALLAIKAELMDEGALGDRSGLEQDVKTAERILDQSKAGLNRAVQTEQAKWSTLAKAQARFVANLADTNAMKAVHTAFGEFWNASTARKKAQQAVAGSQQALTDARQKMSDAQKRAVENVEIQAGQKLKELLLKSSFRLRPDRW